MAGHTPGPWEASNYRVCHSIDTRCGVICDTASRKANRTPENAANAKLIAAAPDLLQALLYVKMYGSQGTIEGGEHREMSVSYFVDAAIAKATA